ncbi:unnamed protein product [Victoria cruziana]
MESCMQSGLPPDLMYTTSPTLFENRKEKAVRAWGRESSVCPSGTGEIRRLTNFFGTLPLVVFDGGSNGGEEDTRGIRPTAWIKLSASDTKPMSTVFLKPNVWVPACTFLCSNREKQMHGSICTGDRRRWPRADEELSEVDHRTTIACSADGCSLRYDELPHSMSHGKAKY